MFGMPRYLFSLSLMLIWVVAPSRSDATVALNPRALSFCNYLMGLNAPVINEDNEISKIENEVYKSLKGKIRTGWTKRGIPVEVGESILSHSQKVRKAVRIYSKNIQGLNSQHASLIGLVHDLAEYHAPDFTPDDRVSATEKHETEKEAIFRFTSAGGAWTSDIAKLWFEYEENKTPEAALVHQLDKLDAGVQAIIYESMGYKVNDFYPYTLGKLSDPTLIRIFNILLEKKHPSVDVYFQYYSLLRLNGDKSAFNSLVQSKLISSH